MECDTDVSAAKRLQEEAALFLLHIRDECKTTQRAIDDIVSGTDNLLCIFLDVLKDKFCQECSGLDGYMTIEQINSLLESFKQQSLFEGIKSAAKMESFLQNKSGGKRVILNRVVMSSHTKVHQGIPVKVPHEYGYSISFLAQLEQLLNCDDVLYCVDNPLPVAEGVYRTVSDGLFYRYHPVVQQHGLQTLIITLHVDDAEVCDPLKSKGNVHNQRLYYWQLGNIYPELRSSLKAINLLAIVKSKIAKKYGNEPFLRYFVEDMKRIGTEGVELSIKGEKRRFYAVLLFVSADHPAAANIGGFKETHFALRPCRACMILRSHLCDNFIVSDNELRRIEEHEIHVKEIISCHKKKAKGAEFVEIHDIAHEEEEDQVQVQIQRYADNENPSVNYGVNSKSILSDIPGFDVTKCLPQDIMHVLAEGVVDQLCRLLLKDVCILSITPNNKKLSLDQLNEVLQKFCDIGHLKKNKPSTIIKQHVIGRKLKQSASQMLVLIRLMPFVLNGLLDESRHALLLKLLKFLDAAMAFTFSGSDITHLQSLINDYGSSFKKIYPDHWSVKLHGICHLTMQIQLFGPLRQQWCFRFEAMHFEFTSMAKLIRNMKNLSLSVAKRYLAKRNYQIMQAQSDGMYLYKGDTVRKPVIVEHAFLPECLLSSFPDLTESTKVFQIHSVTKYGTQWKQGVVVLLGNNQNEIKIFGRIDSVFIIATDVVFQYNEIHTDFISSLSAFKINQCDHKLKVIKLSDLCFPFPVVRFSFQYKGNAESYLILQNPGDM